MRFSGALSMGAIRALMPATLVTTVLALSGSGAQAFSGSCSRKLLQVDAETGDEVDSSASSGKTKRPAAADQRTPKKAGRSSRQKKAG
jgi:hypothetical protein